MQISKKYARLSARLKRKMSAADASRQMVLSTVALAGLTGTVWTYMYFKRIPFLMNDPRARGWESKKTRGEMLDILQPVQAPADNLSNLFEVPTLFYAVSALILARGQVHPYACFV